jgi:hypothetical protein
MNGKIYITGKYSGIEHHLAVAKFEKVAQQLFQAGFTPENIINPTLIVPEGSLWEDAMKICIPLLSNCKGIYIQRDWHDSFGSKHIIKHAQQLHLQMFWEEMNDIELIKNHFLK